MTERNINSKFLIAAFVLHTGAFLLMACNTDDHNLVSGQSDLQLGVSGDKFTINGQPSFLLGVSYFDGRNYHESDLSKLADMGFNLIRIWLDWRDSPYFDENGNWRSGARDDLIRLVDFANNQGLIVDVSILDNNMVFGNSLTKMRQVIEQVAVLLKGKHNVLFDLVNEHDHPDFQIKIGHQEAADFRALVKEIDPDRIVTLSSTGCHLICGSDSDDVNQQNIKEEIDMVGVDLLTPHFLRSGDWAQNIGARVAAIKNVLNSLNKSLPLYLQEENRRATNSGPEKNDFLTAATGAFQAEAAGWIFHTSAGFELDEGTFFENLDSVEQQVIAEVSRQIADEEGN